MSKGRARTKDRTHILVLDVFEELELAICALREDGGAERLHDLLDGDRGASQLILCGAEKRRGGVLSGRAHEEDGRCSPDETERA